MEYSGIIDLSYTLVVALSAIAENQFQNKEIPFKRSNSLKNQGQSKKMFFDKFCKYPPTHSITRPLLNLKYYRN